MRTAEEVGADSCSLPRCCTGLPATLVLHLHKAWPGLAHPLRWRIHDGPILVSTETSPRDGDDGPATRAVMLSRRSSGPSLAVLTSALVVPVQGRSGLPV